MKKNLKFLTISLITGLSFVSCDRSNLAETVSANPLIRGNSNGTNRGPYYTTYNLLGSGYDVTKEYANEESARGQVIDLGKLKSDYPNNRLEDSTFPYSQTLWSEYGENAVTYSEKITKKAGLSLTIPLFKQNLSGSYSSSMTNSYNFDAKYIYASCNLLLKFKHYLLSAASPTLQSYLTDEFKQDLQSYTPQQIVQVYGTHVLIDIYTGAKLEAKFQSETYNSNRSSAAEVGVASGMKDIFNINVNTSSDISNSSKNFNRRLSYSTRGGDPTIALFGDINLDQSAPKVNITSWQSSCSQANSVLVDFGSTAPIIIYDLVSDPIKKSQLKAYVDQYLIENQTKIEYTNQLNLQDGNFVRNRYTGEVFFIFEKKIRYIQSVQTLFGLFNISTGDIRDINPSDIATVQKGNDLTPDNDLRQDYYTKKIYLREGQLLRYIPNLTIYNKYRFNNGAIRRINGTGGYTIGSDLN